MKLLSFLQARLQLSSRAVKRILESNGCRRNGEIERFGSVRLAVQDALEWTSDEPPPRAVVQVVYEDEAFKVFDKPAGWVCQEEDTSGGYLVHRLDKETTGLLLIAKTERVRDLLMELFAQRHIKKSYLALVDGVPQETEGKRSTFLAQKGYYHGQVIWGSASSGKLAETEWKLIQRGASAALLRCYPLTGRTHQIRVHLAEMGHPILMDRQYAKTFRTQELIRRPLLHAERLRFRHPTRNTLMDLSSPLPEDFCSCLARLCEHPHC